MRAAKPIARYFAMTALVATLCAGSAQAQNTPALMKNNADNTLGALGANRAKSMMAALDRLEPSSGAGGDKTASLDRWRDSGFGALAFGADGVPEGDGETKAAFHAGGGQAGAVGIWGGFAYTSYQSEYGTVGSEGSLTTAQAGIDVSVSDDVVLGVMALGDFLDADTDNMMPIMGPIVTTSEGFLVGPYALIGLTDAVHFEGLAAAGRVTNDYTWTNVPTMEYDSDRLLLAARLSGAWTSGGWGVRPEASVSYYAERQEAFTDAGGNQFAETTNMLGQVRLGSEVSHEFAGDGAFIRPFAGVEGVWAYRQDDLLMAGQTVSPDDLSASFSLGLDAQLGSSSVRFAGRYEGAGADDFEATTGEIQLRIPLN